MELAVLGFLFIFIIICIVMLVKTSKTKKIQKKAMKELKAQGLIQQVGALHTYGLPVAEGVGCTIQAYNDHLDFISGNVHVSLNNNKIIDMTIKSETEIRDQYVSSIGGAVGGAVLFGPIGAMIGGRAKKKTAKNIDTYYIITYRNNDNEIAYLGLNVNGCVFQTQKIIAEFKKNNADNRVNIEL